MAERLIPQERALDVNDAVRQVRDRMWIDGDEREVLREIGQDDSADNSCGARDHNGGAPRQARLLRRP